MKPLCRLWSALEDIPGTVAVLADWRNRLGQDFDAASSLLRPTDEYAHSYPDVNDPYSYYKVVPHGDDDIVGVHSNDGSTIKLTKAEVLIYRVDRKRLCQRIAKAFRVSDSQTSVDGAASPILVGTYRPQVGAGFSAYFVIPHESADLQRAVESIAVRHGGSFILVTPTARRMRPDCSSLLKSLQACFLPLTDAVRLEAAGQLVPTPWAEQALRDFCRLVSTGRGDGCSTVSSGALPNALKMTPAIRPPAPGPTQSSTQPPKHGP
jgi:hypothetical protein